MQTTVSKKSASPVIEPRNSDLFCGQEINAQNWREFSQVLLNASRNAISVLDTSGHVIIANTHAQTKLQLMPGSTIATVLPSLHEHMRQVVVKKTKLNGLRTLSRNEAYLSYLEPLIVKNTIVGVICVMESLTDLENANRKMQSYQELSQELDAIISCSDNGLWICDSRGKILRINTASERLNMLHADKIIGRNVKELVEEGYIDDSVTMKVLKSHKRESLLQQTHSGRKLMVTGNPVFNSADELTKVVINEMDITEVYTLREELEAQLAKNDLIQSHIREAQISGLTAGRIIAKSAKMIKTLRQAYKVSQVDSSVLILGESGTGKGLVASLIHSHSPRANKTMIHISCGAIPEALIESELFGYEKGAFTGAAHQGKPGYLELADDGTLFLDEIGEIPLASQAKLLSFLEDGKLTRVGATKAKELDVRIICATNRDLEQMVKQGHFRMDLYYRLNVVPISVPPLRDREACKISLINHFIHHFSTKFQCHQPPHINRCAMNALLTYNYPGNVRELMNICERLVVMSESKEIYIEDLPGSVTSHLPLPIQMRYDFGVMEDHSSLPRIMASVEQRIITQALSKYRTQAKAAEALGINQSTIARKLRSFRQS